MLPVQEAKGSVVDGEPHDAHVVSVEHTMAEANTLPLGHHPCRPPCHLEQSRLVAAHLPLFMPEHPSASPDISGSQCRVSEILYHSVFSGYVLGELVYMSLSLSLPPILLNITKFG